MFLRWTFPDINTISFITQATWMVCTPVPYHLFIGTDGLILPHKGDFQRLSKDPHLYPKKGLPGILCQSSCYELELSLWGPWFCPCQGDLRSHKLWGAAKTKTKTKNDLKTRRGSHAEISVIGASDRRGCNFREDKPLDTCFESLQITPPHTEKKTVSCLYVYMSFHPYARYEISHETVIMK